MDNTDKLSVELNRKTVFAFTVIIFVATLFVSIIFKIIYRYPWHGGWHPSQWDEFQLTVNFLVVIVCFAVMAAGTHASPYVNSFAVVILSWLIAYFSNVFLFGMDTVDWIAGLPVLWLFSLIGTLVGGAIRKERHKRKSIHQYSKSQN